MERRATFNLLERPLKAMATLASLGDYDALYAFGEEAGKTLEVGQDVGTRLEPLMRMLTPKEHL